MQTFEQRDALQEVLQGLRLSQKTIGLVPTMGNLHGGHLALVDAARQHCDFVLATIFVNPLQFGPGEDLDKYPRTLEEDCKLLSARKCDGVFVPSVATMYPEGLENQTQVTVPALSEKHCGLSRPRHFAGVCTVVCKLLNLTQPDSAFFGEKDYQQLQVIRKMAADLCMPITIEGVPIVRNDEGLALSSRNNYLDKKQLSMAPGLYKSLKSAAGKISKGEKRFDVLEQEATASINSGGLKTDYFSICNAFTLETATQDDRDIVILAAAYLGNTRLIDNTVIRL